jgi:hypothetical protein
VKEKIPNDAVRIATWVVLAALIASVAWYYRATREGVEQQGVAQVHSQWMMGLNLLLADAQAYSKNDPSIVPLINSVVTTNPAPAQPGATPR